MKLTMVGTGYVGLVTGVCLANTGNHVVCLDIDPEKIRRLRGGECPIYEPGLTELLQRNIAAGRLTFTLDKDDAYRDAEMVFICVGTPSDDRGHADLQYVYRAADDIAAVMKTLGPGAVAKTVVVKSTVRGGTTLSVKKRILEGTGGRVPFNVANNPEFLKEGDAVNDFLRPDRVVCGVENEEAAQRFRDLYDPFVRNGHPIIVMDILSSEMVKYASNNFLATKISFINEMAMLCEVYGADIGRVREGMIADRRIGHEFLYPGLGYGGSCFPKDTLACMMMGDSTGHPMLLSRAVHEVNQNQRARFFSKIEEHFASRGGLAGKKLAFWGLAFKPRTDDVREAPALTLVHAAIKAGASVVGYDPVAGPNAAAEVGAGLALASDMYSAVDGADALVVCTDWDDFKSPDFAEVRRRMREATVFDGRNLYRGRMMAELKFNYYSVGRAPVNA